MTAVAYSETRYGWTVGRGRWQTRHRSRPVRDARHVRWELGEKIYIFRDRNYGSALWWTRCGQCWLAYQRAFTLSRTHEQAVQAAVRHALTAHDVVL